MKVKGKIAIVTGASGGIGPATAKLLAEKGAKVALLARSKAKLEKISKQLTDSYVVVADMSKPDQVRKMIKKVYKHYGRIDILVNNAGQGYDSLVEGIKLDTFRKIFDLDLVGPLVAMQEIIPLMRKQGGGVIVNISSGTALMQLPNMAAYSSLKRALTQISLTANIELNRDNIFVSVVYPYITDTDFEKNTIKHKVNWSLFGNSSSARPADTANYVAEKIVEGIQKEESQIYIHDWMKPKKD